MANTPDTIIYGKLSEGYAIGDIKRNGLYGGGQDLKLPRKLYCVYKNVEWMYDLSPSNSTLQGTTNYLYGLCGQYALKAAEQAISGGIIVNPIVPVPGVPLSIPFYKLTKADFGSSSTDYLNTRLVDKDLSVFVQNWNRNLESDEYVVLADGTFRVLATGFDAQLFDSGKLIMVIYVNGEASADDLQRLFQYDLTTDTSITGIPSGLDYQVRRFVIRPNGFSYTWDTDYFEFDDLHPEQPDAIGVGTVQIYDFVYDPISGKNLCSNQIITV